MTDKLSVLTLSSKVGPRDRVGEPVVIGIPLPQKSLEGGHHLELIDGAGQRVPCDVTVLDKWPDNSARWALLAFAANYHGEAASFSINLAQVPEKPQDALGKSFLRIVEKNGGMTVDTGKAMFTLGPGEGWPIRQICGPDGENWLESEGNGIHLTMEDGSTPRCGVRDIRIEVKGAVRFVARCLGVAQLASGKRVEVEWRLEFFAGLPTVLVHVTVRNPHKAMHPDGYWELGDSGSLLLREMAFKLRPSNPLFGCDALCSPEPGMPMQPVKVPFEIYQDSSGGENWQSLNHVNRQSRTPVTFRGYRFSDAGVPASFRATPIVAMKAACGTLALASRHFWQNFPKAVEISGSEISYGLFPRQWNDLHELQGGEQKTHSFALSFGADAVTESPLEWFRQPLLAALNPAWVEKTAAVQYFTPANEDPHSQYLSLVDLAIEGNDTFDHKRERVDEYGWRHFGDLYADHEAVYAENFQGTGPLMSHYNNQYDEVAGFCYHWLRSGDSRWWTQFNELASHVTDIDIYHTNEDKSAYNHGLFWHTFHYVDAGRSTHRSYPRVGKSNGGGPSNEHLYATGLMLHYFITGNSLSRDAAIGLAQFVIDMDDGSKTVFKWLARGATGLASKSRSFDYHGPGRGSGNALSALVDGHRLTGDSKFLLKAEELIRRVSHPDQNIEKLTLLDAENRWFYTMYLQALGKYLDRKAELGQLDSMYAYGRATLLHFARWMAKNEYPFLEKPEILEYPTETWVAQDMRKSEVFKYAWLHAPAEDRESFAERARFFFHYTCRTLSEMKTRSLCRPVALLLAFGWMQAWCEKHTSAKKPQPKECPEHWTPQADFVPQKTLALRRAKLGLAAGGIVFVGAVIAVGILLF
jgi:hypothetical protein